MAYEASALRPRHVTVIAILWIVWGGINAVNGVASALAALQASAQLDAMAAEAGVRFPDEHTEGFAGVALLAAVIAVVSGAGAVGGVFLLRLRAWARTLVEAASWASVGIVAVFAYQALRIAIIGAVARRPYLYFGDPRHAGLFDVPGDEALGVLLRSSLYLLGAVPFVIIALRLRRQDTREPILRAWSREQQAGGGGAAAGG